MINILYSILFTAIVFSASSIASAAPGDLDLTFDAGALANSNSSFISISAVVVQPDGKILIGGSFMSVGGTLRNTITRLNADGSLDLSFTTPVMSNGSVGVVTAIVVQPDGKILVGGHFLIGTDVKNTVRLNANGSLDGTFNTMETGGQFVSSLVLQPDGKIIIGGQIGNYGGVSGSGIVRLNQNGSLDTALGLTADISNTVYAIALQADGKIIVGGVFVVSNPVPFQFNIIRMNANGALDNTFGVGSGTNNFVNAIAIQLDGKILVSGAFSTFNGTTRNQIVRLNVNGSFDSAFNASSTSGAGVLTINGEKL